MENYRFNHNIHGAQKGWKLADIVREKTGWTQVIDEKIANIRFWKSIYEKRDLVLIEVSLNIPIIVLEISLHLWILYKIDVGW